MNRATIQPEPLRIAAELPPLRFDEGGVIRVGDSRVTLDLVVQQYESGMTPEDMVRAYDTLKLADVHAAISYFLRHTDQVKAYLASRQDEAAAVQAKLEKQQSPVRQSELLARRAAEKLNAPTGQ